MIYNVLMYYEFSLNALFVGIAILIIGGLMVIFYQKIADNFLGGVGSYEKTKLYGLIVCGIGIIIMTSLHSIPLNWLVHSLFKF